jgi:hypothetical protein
LQVTQERLKDELAMRRTELEKIDTLEDKIKNELVQLADKSEQLKKNIETYTNVSDRQPGAGWVGGWGRVTSSVCLLGAVAGVQPL